MVLREELPVAPKWSFYGTILTSVQVGAVQTVSVLAVAKVL